MFKENYLNHNFIENEKYNIVNKLDFIKFYTCNVCNIDIIYRFHDKKYFSFQKELKISCKEQIIKNIID